MKDQHLHIRKEGAEGKYFNEFLLDVASCASLESLDVRAVNIFLNNCIEWEIYQYGKRFKAKSMQIISPLHHI